MFHLGYLGRSPTSAWLVSLLTSDLAHILRFRASLRGQKALLHVVLHANAASAFSVHADFGAVVAFGHVWLWRWLWTHGLLRITGL